jgi:quercetin 2,3-dioxygenase
MSEPTSDRVITKVITAHRQREGAGFLVRRPFPSTGVEQVDPFLLLDEMGPSTYGPGEAVGAPDHPHRGFETVTYMLEGEFEHEDSAGHGGRIGPGDVQWMTAGDGVVHSEMPSKRIREEGGTVHGFQLWVNLPARDKRIAPRYQGIPASRIPEATSEDGKARVRVVAGEALGAQAVIDTRTPIAYHHWRLAPGAHARVRLRTDMNACVYVFAGEAQVGPDATAVGEGQCALLGEGEVVRLACDGGAAGEAQLLLLAGVPLREPVAWYGPFVMNTADEIRQAIVDYQEGRLGQIRHWVRPYESAAPIDAPLPAEAPLWAPPSAGEAPRTSAVHVAEAHAHGERVPSEAPASQELPVGPPRAGLLSFVLRRAGWAVGAALLLLGAGYSWFRGEAQHMRAERDRVRSEAQLFASHTSQGDCPEEALRRLDGCDSSDVWCGALAKVFLSECLSASEPAPRFCAKVPAFAVSIESEAWRAQVCRELGRPDHPPCGRLMEGVLEHCGEAPASASAMHGSVP